MAPTTGDRAAPSRTGDAQAPARPSGLAARITADETNNAIIVYGTPHDYAVVEDALRRLDIPPMQVLIEAAITEVSLTDDLRFGVQWNFQTGSSNFALSEGTTISPTRILPGFSYFYSGNDISATLNALEQRTNVKVISAPKLLVLNNQTAALQVGDQVPVQTQSSVSTDGNSPIINSIQYRDTGVILRVTPRVNAGGLVLLDISQEVSDVSNTTTSEINSPTIATRRIATTVAVQDGQVIALGGLFRNSQTFGKNGLPILSRIPVLGSMLFGNTKNMQRRTELIVLIKPRVVRSIDDGRAITEELRAKLRTLEPFKTQGRIP
jgi:general secretion pathway protein D